MTVPEEFLTVHAHIVNKMVNVATLQQEKGIALSQSLGSQFHLER